LVIACETFIMTLLWFVIKKIDIKYWNLLNCTISNVFCKLSITAHYCRNWQAVLCFQLANNHEGEAMTSKTKSYIFTAFFCFCVVIYLLLPSFPTCSEFVQSLDIFGHDHDNFIFLMIAFVSIAYILTELTAYFSRFTARMNWLTPKIGKILLSQGCITQNELNQALMEQGYKIGKVLVQEGRITPQQLDTALALQKNKNRLIGEILTELGYTTDGDICWALNKTHRRIGTILREKNLVTGYDLSCALTLKKCRVDDQGRIFEKE